MESKRQRLDRTDGDVEFSAGRLRMVGDRLVDRQAEERQEKKRTDSSQNSAAIMIR